MRIGCIFKSAYGTLGGATVYFYDPEEAVETQDDMIINLYETSTSLSVTKKVAISSMETVPKSKIDSTLGRNRLIS